MSTHSLRDRDDPRDRPALGPPPELNPCRDPALDFRDRDLKDMTPTDYAAIGFLSGLEVHQQLLTRSKLFCRCPAGRYVASYDAEVLRQMRPTLSEMGEYDRTALMEFKTHKEIHYLLERGTVCTYELDDTPPFEIDEQAVRTAIEVALLFNLNLVSELHVMRKQYLDGSIPTGFQRTVMIGIEGAIPFRAPELGVDRELRIRQLSLEEDSCREVSDAGHRIVFRTDRLGIPLTEVVTEPDFLTPFEVRAGARLIARNTRVTGKVRRGPGAARQDVNVSVAGGRRVEIKGVDSHRSLARLVHTEAFRQLNLLRIRAELHRRGVVAEMLALPETGKPWEVSPLVIDATRTLRHCDFAPIRDALDQDGVAAAVRLAGFAGLLARRTQPGVAFAAEFEDRVRVIACLVGRPFMIHSDIRNYGIRSAEWRHVRTAVAADPGDEVIVVWGAARDVETAVREILIRAREALEGVPPETRQAFPDGTTGFERILPGPNRMYPDTDTPPVAIKDEWVESIRAQLPARPWERALRYEKLGLEPDLARRLVDASWSGLFDALEPARGEVARRVAIGLEKRLPHIRRRDGLSVPSGPERLEPIVRALEAGRLRPEAFEIALDRALEQPGAAVQAILAALQPLAPDDPALERRLALVLERTGGLVGKPGAVVLRWVMGQVMRPLRGRVDPRRVEARLRQALADGPAGSGDARSPGVANVASHGARSPEHRDGD